MARRRCGKISYLTEESAQFSIDRMNEMPNAQGKRLKKIYRCNYCNAFHITSQSRKGSKEIDDNALEAYKKSPLGCAMQFAKQKGWL